MAGQLGLPVYDASRMLSTAGLAAAGVEEMRDVDDAEPSPLLPPLELKPTPRPTARATTHAPMTTPIKIIFFVIGGLGCPIVGLAGAAIVTGCVALAGAVVVTGCVGLAGTGFDVTG